MIQDGLKKLVDQIAQANGYRWSITSAWGEADFRISFIHTDPLKSWFFDCCAPTESDLLDKVRDEFLPACRNLGMKIPSDEVKLPSCKQCGGKQVKIRGRFPKSGKRIVCPTCQADTLAVPEL